MASPYTSVLGEQRCTGQKEICTGVHLASLNKTAAAIHSLPWANKLKEKSVNAVSNTNFFPHDYFSFLKMAALIFFQSALRRSSGMLV